MQETRPETIRRAAELIRTGGVVAFPTETVYGLGADALNPLAVARIFEIKNRPYFDPLIVHIADARDLSKLTTSLPGPAEKLIRRFWPGPLTVVLPKKDVVPELVTAGLVTVAVRMPKHPIALQLIRETETFLAAPSANPFGYVSPTTAGHVRDQLGDRVDLILDGGACEVGLESTIVSFSEVPPTLLRPGGLTLEEIESVIGKIRVDRKEGEAPASPGRLPRHYAPRTPIRVEDWKKTVDRYPQKRLGLLSLHGVSDPGPFQCVEVLSSRGDLREAAANLFAAIRRLDERGLDLILADPPPEAGLGRAPG